MKLYSYLLIRDLVVRLFINFTKSRNNCYQILKIKLLYELNSRDMRAIPRYMHVDFRARGGGVLKYSPKLCVDSSLFFLRLHLQSI